MITFITGVPGAGKTINTIKRVLEEWPDTDRPIFYRGIKDVTLPWTEINEDEARNWFDYPAGSIFIIDESQQVWPNRPANQPIPESVKRMDTHRHGGYDFYIITQKPTMVDFGIRGFAGRHYHYERGFNREATRQLEWQRAVDNPIDYHTRQEAQVSRVKFDKKLYNVYKSAEVHTHKPRIPKGFWYFAGAIVFTFAAGAYAYISISERSETNEETTFRPDQTNAIPIGLGRKSETPLTDTQYIQQWIPRVENMPLSAPIYDEVLEVKSYPLPNCIRNDSRNTCKCYTQQATPIEVTFEACNSYVDNGWFNPYIEDLDTREAEREQQAQAQPASAPETPTPTQPRIIYLPDTHDFRSQAQVSPQVIEQAQFQPARLHNSGGGTRPNPHHLPNQPGF